MIQNNNTQNKNIRAEWILAQLIQEMPEIVKIGGKPEVISGKYGKALSFNGKSDIIFIEDNPLADLGTFTVEILFMPASGGNFEQRFLHCGEVQGDRMLLELRATETHWYFDAFIATGEEKCTLIDPNLLHPLDEWYHVAYVIDKGNLKTYVNGKKELESNIVMKPVEGNRTSAGARQNEVSWFRGAIYKIRITGEALTPENFMDH